MPKTTSHYYSENQDSREIFNEIEVRFFGRTIRLRSVSGVFSVKKIDKGTEVLLNNSALEDGWDVLDLGCGYGAVGVSVALGFPRSRVVMTDINKRAVKTARFNIKQNGISNAEVRQGDGLSKIADDELFDTILLNPPQSAGKQLCMDLISEAKEHLKKGGSLQIVARHKKGGRSLSEHMEKVYGNVEVLGIKSGYRVYMSIRKR